MTFEPFSYHTTIGDRLVSITVEPSLLRRMWGASAGPQDAAGLVAANRAILDELAGMKLADTDDRRIVLGEIDYDPDEPAIGEIDPDEPAY